MTKISFFDSIKTIKKEVKISDINKKIEFEKKEKLYKKLGAIQFRKIVLMVEKIKFKIIDKFCPNIYLKFNNFCDKKVSKLCNENITDEEKRKLIFEYNSKKMAFKRELEEKRNVNYHFDLNNASKFYKYLEWNKKVHQKSMIADIIYIIISILGILVFNNFLFVFSIATLILFCVSFIIDFECVNLQNYNICKFEEKKYVLEQIEKRRKEKDFNRYSKVSKEVFEELVSSIELPKSETIVSKLTTSEQIEQLRELALEIKRQREYDESNTQKVKRK